MASAYKYQLRHPAHTIAVLEKEERLGMHQTGRNSGVIHSGIYYTPGSYKARTCTSGREQLVAFAQKYGVKHEVCGKIILATEPDELPRLQKIYERGQANGLEGLELIDPEAIQAIEPHARGLQAIRVPQTGIVDYRGLIEKLAALLSEINPHSGVLLNTRFERSIDENGQAGVLTNRGKYYAPRKIFCGGLQSDRLARKDGARPEVAIVGFRGDYYQLTERARHKVKHLIYPVPDPAFPFLGVHFTRMTDHSVECGPNAVFSFKREGYQKTSFSWRDTAAALSFPGTWKLFAKHTAHGWNEMQRAFSKPLFLKALQKMIPDLQMDDIEPVRSGVRAQALKRDGSLVDDFSIVHRRRSVHVLNAPSPAATACLAIADEILAELDKLSD